MSGRRDRVGRLVALAEDAEQRARARLREVNLGISTIDRRRESALRRADQLADLGLPLQLQTHLTGAGARHLIALADEKNELLDEVDRRRAEHDEALTKVRSLERLVERIDEAEAARRDRFEQAELQDLLAIRAAREAR